MSVQTLWWQGQSQWEQPLMYIASVNTAQTEYHKTYLQSAALLI